MGLKERRLFIAESLQKVVTCALEHAEFIYIRAERCASLYEKVKKRSDWETVEINNEIYQVRSFPFDSFEGLEHCRLVVQRQKRKSNEQMDLFDGEYTYRCILTNDWNMEDEQVIRYYNQRGASERVFDQMNNDFGWNSLPKSFMNENVVFLLITAMAHNFYHYLVSIPLMALFGIEPTSRIKRFIFKFISVPAKWIKTARTHVIKFYTSRPYDKIFAFE